MNIHRDVLYCTAEFSVGVIGSQTIIRSESNGNNPRVNEVRGQEWYCGIFVGQVVQRDSGVFPGVLIAAVVATDGCRVFRFGLGIVEADLRDMWW